MAAAEEAYDRTASCSFTAFIGYEHTDGNANGYRHAGEHPDRHAGGSDSNEHAGRWAEPNTHAHSELSGQFDSAAMMSAALHATIGAAAADVGPMATIDMKQARSRSGLPTETASDRALGRFAVPDTVIRHLEV